MCTRMRGDVWGTLPFSEGRRFGNKKGTVNPLAIQVLVGGYHDNNLLLGGHRALHAVCLVSIVSFVPFYYFIYLKSLCYLAP